MKIELLACALVLICTWLSLSAFYRLVVTPIVVQRSSFTLYALRDELRGIEPKSDDDRRCRAVLEDVINSAIRKVPTSNLIQFVEWVLTTRKDAELRQEVSAAVKARARFLAKASEEMKAIERKCCAEMTYAMMVNSPWVSFFVYLVYMFRHQLAEAWRAKSEVFLFRNAATNC